MNMEIVVVLFAIVASFLIVNFLISKYCRDWEAALHYQNLLFDHVRGFVDDRETPDEIARFANAVFHIATMRGGTFVFVFLVGIRNLLPEKTANNSRNEGLSTVLRNSPLARQEKIAEMLFVMAVLLRKKSLFFGWLVFPVIISIGSSRDVKPPNSLKDAITAKTVLRAFSGEIADC